MMHDTQTPIWAPTPGVPLLARVLSYTFAAAMVLTFILTCSIQRPPSTPVMPKGWLPHTSTAGYMITYPVEWKAFTDTPQEDVKLDGVVHKQVIREVFTTGGGVEVDILTCEPTMSADEFLPIAESEATSRFVAEFWDLDNYRSTNEFVTGEPHTFSGQTNMPDSGIPFRSHTVDMVGQWQVLRMGEKVLIVVALTPQEGGPVMQTIVTRMVGSLATT
jgi:hypothetical protein